MHSCWRIKHGQAESAVGVFKAQEVIFKGTRDGLRLVIDADENIENLKDSLRRRLQEADGFYSGGRVRLDTRGAVVPSEWIEEVRMILEEYGLSLSEEKPAGRRQRQRAADSGASGARKARNDGGSANGELAPRGDTILVRRTLRSGQAVSFDGNVVVMGDVNPGSEVLATGDIVVFGSLRGIAHAGSAGKADACVVALRLVPTQLRIADKITRAPDDETQMPQGPEVAYLREGSIVIEPWTTHTGTVLV
ncbi:MAG TPA: septum site-determining protein MinC [Firmicutes bacterium]|nr:septum site-determining protein MinC [Bacillota bacterium]